MAIKKLTPRSKEELISALREEPINEEVLKACEVNEIALRGVASFISEGISESSIKSRVDQINGFAEVIKFLLRESN